MDDQQVLALIKTLLQMNQDHKMHERYCTIRDFKWGADLRFQANRLQTVAERLSKISQAELASLSETESVLEAKGGLSLEQVGLLNDRTAVPYMQILFYGHGGEPMEVKEIKADLLAKKTELRGIADMLFGYMDKHFSGDQILIRPDRKYLEASIWRTRITAGLYCVATYYKLASELINLALFSLEKVSLAGRDMIKEDKRQETVLILNMVTTLLNESAKYMGMAATELGCDEDRWRRMEMALESILKGGE